MNVWWLYGQSTRPGSTLYLYNFQKQKQLGRAYFPNGILAKRQDKGCKG